MIDRNLINGPEVLIFCDSSTRLAGSSLGRPSLEEKEGGGGDATTTPESIEKIFHKYNQQYPFHGGPVPEDQAELQNDEPVMEAIIERLNEIMRIALEGEKE